MKKCLRRDRAECCEMLSSGHDIASELMNTTKPWLPIQGWYKTEMVNIPAQMGEAWETPPFLEDQSVLNG